jgi:hypothetical protein
MYRNENRYPRKIIFSFACHDVNSSSTIFKKTAEQQDVLKDFWKKAGLVLSGSGVELKPIPREWTALGHNYFSVLFIAAFFHLGIPLSRLRLYARINHCLRSWVTSCDNLTR